MIGWAVIGIINTVIVMSLTIIGVQITMFIYLMRRMDAMSESEDATQKGFAKDFVSVRQEVSALAERVAHLEGIIIGRPEVGNELMQTGDD